MVSNKLNSFNISIQSPIDSTDSLDLYMYKGGNTKIDVTFINGSPFVDINIKLKARISSMNKNSQKLTNENIELVEQSINSYLKGTVTDFLYKTSLNYNSDICGIGQYALSKFLTNQDLKSYNWLDNYQNCIFRVNIDSKVISGLLYTEL